jgi:hypothetical protein
VVRRARDYEDYLAAVAATPAEQIDYVAVVVFGPRNRVTLLTKRFALYAPAGKPPRVLGSARRKATASPLSRSGGSLEVNEQANRWPL